MKIMVLGANGFIGRNIVTNLSIHGYEVVPITRSDATLSNFAEVAQLLNKHKVYAVINCAIPGGRNKIDNLDQSDFDEHLNIFLNFYNLSFLFQKFISIGSGAEFDRRRDIFNAHESDIFMYTPVDLYGHLKNTIARISAQHSKFYNLRLFGCFDKLEDPNRFFKKIKKSSVFEVDDRYFDFISIKDFCTIVRYYLNNDVIYRDINCVYKDKLKLSQLASKFVIQHKLSTIITAKSEDNLNYIGNSSRLEILKLPLDGLIKGIAEYNE